MNMSLYPLEPRLPQLFISVSKFNNLQTMTSHKRGNNGAVRQGIYIVLLTIKMVSKQFYSFKQEDSVSM